MGWFIAQSLLFIVITATIFFAIGLWVGWILWARRNKTTGKHTAETPEKKPASTTAQAKADATTSGATAAEHTESGTTGTEKPETRAETSDAPSASEATSPLAAPSEDTATGTAEADAAASDSPAATSPDDTTTSATPAEPSDIEDENLAVYAGVEAQVVAEAEAATREAASDGTTEQDDLTRIEGVGPKVAAALQTGGYGSYATLAEASEDDIRRALAESGITFAPAAMSFAAQAQYLVEGDEEGLEEYQDYLIAGRERRSADFVEDVDYTDVDEVEGAEARQEALEADAAKVAAATGTDVDSGAVTDDAAVAGANAETAGAEAAVATQDAGEPKEAATAPSEPASPADEDLKVIEGIGPKIEKALKSAGITSYAQVATLSVAELREAIREYGIKFAPSVKSWAQQAQYLVDEDTDGLNEYQDYLVAGQERGTTKFVEEVDYTDVDEIEGEAAKQAALTADAKKVAEAEGGGQA